MHLDLHETTDTDDTEFRPAKAARDGETEQPKGSIPDGFYLVSDETRSDDVKVQGWYTAMIEAVRRALLQRVRRRKPSLFRVCGNNAGSGREPQSKRWPNL